MILGILCALTSHHSSVNISTTNVPIHNQTKGGDSVRYNLLSTNSIKKLNWFCIVGCEIIATSLQSKIGCLARRCCSLHHHHHRWRRFCEYLSNQGSNRDSDKRRWFSDTEAHKDKPAKLFKTWNQKPPQTKNQKPKRQSPNLKSKPKTKNQKPPLRLMACDSGRDYSQPARQKNQLSFLMLFADDILHLRKSPQFFRFLIGALVAEIFTDP